jgi:hypothetical protein
VGVPVPLIAWISLETLFLRILDVPIFVQRHLPATKTACVPPLVQAFWTTPSSNKCIPRTTATGKEKFWRTNIRAHPTVKRARLPSANWATNLGKIRRSILELLDDLEIKLGGI